MPKGIYIRKEFTKEHKNNISLSKKGISLSNSHKLKLSLAHKGNIFSDEHKYNLRMSHLGKKHSEEHKINISIANKGNKKSEEYCDKYLRGKNSPSYKHGLSNTKEYIKFYNKKCHYARKCAGFLSVRTIQLVYEDNIKKYGTLTCYLCELPIEFGKDSLEHKIPISRGGNNDYENLAVACQSCNCKKYNKTEQEYRKEK